MALGPRPYVGGCFWHYRAYDADGRLLYLGVTTNPETRVRQHKYRSPWFSQVDHFEWRPAGSDRMAALWAEAEAQRVEKPMHGTTHAQAMERRLSLRAEAHEAGVWCATAGCVECRRANRPKVAIESSGLRNWLDETRASA